VLGRSGLERLAQGLEPRAFSRYIEAEVTIGIRRESVPRLRERPQRAHAVSPAEVMEAHTHLNQRLKEAARWAAHTNPDVLERLVTLEEAAAVELAHGPLQGDPIVAQKLRLGMNQHQRRISPGEAAFGVTDREASPMLWRKTWQRRDFGSGGRGVADSFRRPYRVTIPMVILVMLVPGYLIIARFARAGTTYVPEFAFDRALPLVPAWSLVYGALYLFLIILPVLVVREEEHIRRTVRAYLLCWVTAYAVFAFYPTAASRPAHVTGDGFGIWGLLALYESDPPYNCFPSLHVAHSFVSALTCYRLHRGVGILAVLCASLVGLSTLLTKQHYVVDVIAGILLACVAYGLFLRSYPRDRVPAIDRDLAPDLAMTGAGIAGIGLLGAWVAYLTLGADILEHLTR
jgi:membrane-associated phospholipid phosphatase